MIELPESLTYAKLLKENVNGKTVSKVLPANSPHKFFWTNAEWSDYEEMLEGRTVCGAEGFGIFVDILLEDDIRLTFNDGVNVRLIDEQQERPKKYQLLLEFDDGCALSFSVAMYGGAFCHKSDFDNEYYLKNKSSLSVLDPAFNEAYFNQLLQKVKPTLSAKAFLATEQRIVGLGNGVLQDILFKAGIHPKRKVQTLSEDDVRFMFENVKAVMTEITEKGGRDTEKNLLGEAGGYRTLLSKNTVTRPCPCCGSAIVKEAYLGGAVYYCPICQPL